MEEKEKYDTNANAPGPDTPPEQEPPQQEPPSSALQVHFAGPGIAHITKMQTAGEVTLGQLSYLGMFLVAQALHEWGAPLMHEVIKGTILELSKPKIEPARAGFNIPPEMLKPN